MDRTLASEAGNRGSTPLEGTNWFCYNRFMNQKGFVNIILVVAVAVAITIGGYFVLSDKSMSPQKQDRTLQALPLNTSDNVKKSIIKIPFVHIDGSVGFGDAVGYNQELMNKARETGELVGCGDKVVYVSKEIDATTQPLNAAYKELFAIGSTIQFEGKELANPIADQTRERIIAYENKPADVFKPLRFVKVEIQDNVAVVYLEGDILSNECNDPRVEAQIVFTAKQLSNINEVKTFLNNKEFNWSKWMNQRGW